MWIFEGTQTAVYIVRPKRRSVRTQVDLVDGLSSTDKDQQQEIQEGPTEEEMVLQIQDSEKIEVRTTF